MFIKCTVSHSTQPSLTVNFGLNPICHGALTGQVLDSVTGQPITTANVGLSNSSNGPPEQAQRLKACGVDKVNHNLNTSERFYPEICTTHTWQDRVDTLKAVRAAGLELCSGGIIGMGESRDARLRLLQQLAALDPHPESVPINLLVAVEGTPLAGRPPEDPLDLVRMIATARILMPRSYVRLSAGRLSLSDEGQALCFLAGANSVFLGDRLLTTPNPTADVDRSLFDRLGLRLQEGHEGHEGDLATKDTKKRNVLGGLCG